MLHPDGDDGCWSENRISASFHHWATHQVWQRGVPHVLSINQIFSIVVLNSATFNWEGGTTSTAVELHYNQDLSWSWLFQKRKSLFVMDLQGVSQRHSVFCIYFPSCNSLNFYHPRSCWKCFFEQKKSLKWTERVNFQHVLYVFLSAWKPIQTALSPTGIQRPNIPPFFHINFPAKGGAFHQISFRIFLLQPCR